MGGLRVCTTGCHQLRMIDTLLYTVLEYSRERCVLHRSQTDVQKVDQLRQDGVLCRCTVL